MGKFYRVKYDLKMSVAILVVLFISGCSDVFYSSGLLKEDHSFAKEILGPINEARSTGATCGNKYYKPGRPVVWNDKLGRAALQHCLDMSQKGFLSHTGSDGSNPGERLSKAGYSWSLCGENVGQGFRNPEDAVKLWLKSEMHCKNIMNPKFEEAGAAFSKSSNGRSYWTLVLGNWNQ